MKGLKKAMVRVCEENSCGRDEEEQVERPCVERATTVSGRRHSGLKGVGTQVF